MSLSTALMDNGVSDLCDFGGRRVGVHRGSAAVSHPCAILGKPGAAAAGA